MAGFWQELAGSSVDHIFLYQTTFCSSSIKIQCSMSLLKYSTEIKRLLLAKGVGDKITHGG
jgi:hypothetical protein